MKAQVSPEAAETLRAFFTANGYTFGAMIEAVAESIAAGTISTPAFEALSARAREISAERRRRGTPPRGTPSI